MKRDFLRISDVSPAELQRLLDEAARSKTRPLAAKPLAGRTVALVFQKPSMRTRVSFEVATQQLGGSSIYLGQDHIQLGQREECRDVARALSRYVDTIVVRTFTHHDVESFASHSRCPVVNGLSDLEHPCQALADLLTIQERFGWVKGLSLAYIGDGNNVLHSLAIGAGMLGMHVAVATPHGYKPDAAVWREAVRRGKAHGARMTWTTCPQDAARGADVIYTDVWTSMGQEKERAKRLKAFKDYQVNKKLLSVAKKSCRVLHCLPAHRGEEISDEVMEGRQSLIFEQAENRLHAQKALLAFLLRGAKGTR